MTSIVRATCSFAIEIITRFKRYKNNVNKYLPLSTSVFSLGAHLSAGNEILVKCLSKTCIDISKDRQK
jgi:hypothetical protein